MPQKLWAPYIRLRCIILSFSFIPRLAKEIFPDPNTIKSTDLTMLCSTNTNMASVAGYLSNFLGNFEISKSRLPPNDRHLMHQHFVSLGKRCRKRKNSKQAISLAKKLADSAYKLPERKLSISTKKTGGKGVSLSL